MYDPCHVPYIYNTNILYTYLLIYVIFTESFCKNFEGTRSGTERKTEMVEVYRVIPCNVYVNPKGLPNTKDGGDTETCERERPHEGIPKKCT